MPLEETHCGDCGTSDSECPSCGGGHVTPMDNPGTMKPNTAVKYGPDGTLEYTNICWDCGWSETVTVEIQRTEES